MNHKPFTFRARRTPRGKHIVEALYGDDVVATGKHAHPDAESALREVQTALDNLSLDSIIKPNGKLMELIQ